MRTMVGTALAVVLATAFGMWVQSSSDHAKSAAPAAAKATNTPMLPIALMRRIGKDLPDNTVLGAGRGRQLPLQV